MKDLFTLRLNLIDKNYKRAVEFHKWELEQLDKKMKELDDALEELRGEK